MKSCLRLKFTRKGQDLSSPDPTHKKIQTAEESESFDIPLDQRELNLLASGGSFFSYVAGTASVILNKFNTEIISKNHGIEIDNYKSTLPMRKGLSSSAAVCVLVAKCFDAVYNLELDIGDIMELAYLGEMKTPSR